MKALLNLFTLSLFVLILPAGQLSAQLEVNPDLRVNPWFDNQTVEVFGHEITRVFGESYDRTAHRTDNVPFTNAAYKTHRQLAEEMKERAAEEKWTDKKLYKKLEELENQAIGGRIYVYLQRAENDLANGKYYLVVLRDEDDEKFFTKEIGYNEPEFGDFGLWANLFTIDLPVNPEYPFYIYVSDRNVTSLPEFKFKVLN